MVNVSPDAWKAAKEVRQAIKERNVPKFEPETRILTENTKKKEKEAPVEASAAS